MGQRPYSVVISLSASAEDHGLACLGHGLPAENAQTIVLLRRDVAPNLRRITAS